MGVTDARNSTDVREASTLFLPRATIVRPSPRIGFNFSMALALHHEICLLRATVFPTSHHDLLLTQMRAITRALAARKQRTKFDRRASSQTPQNEIHTTVFLSARCTVIARCLSFVTVRFPSCTALGLRHESFAILYSV
jgi:hypothetical protein